MTSLIQSYGEAVEKLESGPASVHPEIMDKRATERIGRYVGQASVRITVRDFTVLGELVSNMSGDEPVTITGPWWALRTDSQAYRDARLAAARDAMVRAREYAQAFGGSIAGLIEVADAGLLTAHGEHGPGFRGGSLRAAASAAGQPQAELDFSPSRQTVTAQVEARFAMTLPES